MLLLLLLFVGIGLPQTVDAATTVNITYKGTTTTYGKVKNKVYVNGKKISLSSRPVYMKEDSYVGPAKAIFKSSSLAVTYKTSGNGKYLTLTYNGHVLKMTNGKKKALLDGKKTKFGTAPYVATYTATGKERWIVPIKSVCNRLGITYKLTSSGKIKLTGDPNGSSTSTASSQSTDKVVVVLDAGHGGSDSGATNSKLGKKEKNMTLAIVKAAKSYFDKDSRFKVYYTRTSDTYPSLDDRCNLANKVNADIFISVHINSAAATSTGTETEYNPSRDSKTKKNGITSTMLATAMQKTIVSSTGLRNRGLTKRPNLVVLKKTKMPSCLLEYGFISNKTECIKMCANLSRYGKELYQGIVSFMKAKKQI